MPEYVRVRHNETGHEYSVPKSLVRDDCKVVDKPALGRNGEPAPVLYRTKLGTPRPGSKQAQKRETKTPEATGSGNNASRLAAPKKEN